MFVGLLLLPVSFHEELSFFRVVYYFHFALANEFHLALAGQLLELQLHLLRQVHLLLHLLHLLFEFLELFELFLKFLFFFVFFCFVLEEFQLGTPSLSGLFHQKAGVAFGDADGGAFLEDLRDGRVQVDH